MGSRHLTRSIVLQSLFQWDFNQRKEDPEKILLHNLEEFGEGLEEEDVNFAKELLSGIILREKDLDKKIVSNATEWPIDQIAIIDRCVLRIGLYELLFGNREAVPPKVALNEAIELGKNFGGENSGKFINGVLGAVYRDIGEPGKEYKKSKEEKEESVETPKVIKFD